MVGKVLWSLMAVSALTLTAGQVQGSPYDRVAYSDSNFGTAGRRRRPRAGRPRGGRLPGRQWN